MKREKFLKSINTKYGTNNGVPANIREELNDAVVVLTQPIASFEGDMKFYVEGKDLKNALKHNLVDTVSIGDMNVSYIKETN